MTQPSLEADVAVLKSDMRHVADSVAEIVKDMKAILKWQEDKLRDSAQVRGDFRSMIERIDNQSLTLAKIVSDDKDGLYPRLGKLEASYAKHVIVDNMFRSFAVGTISFGIGAFVWAWEHIRVIAK